MSEQAQAERPKHPGGRPPEPYDHALAMRVCETIRASGCGFDTACEVEGLPGSTGRLWRDAHPEFMRAHKKALGEWRRDRAVQATETAESGDTVMRIFLAKVAHPEEWRDRPAQQVLPALTVPEGRSIKRLVVELDGEGDAPSSPNATDSTAR